VGHGTLTTITINCLSAND